MRFFHVSSVFLALCSAASSATLAGLWEFGNASNLGEATFGNDLIFGPAAPTHSTTMADDSATSLSGVITTVGGTTSYIKALHAIPANGGGTFVNQYSIVVDLFSPVASRSSYRAILQTAPGPTTNDADYFIRNSDDKLGVSAIGYSSGAINETVWTRLVVTVDLTLASDDVVTYLDGSLFYTHTPNQGLDGRYSLYPATSSNGVYFFADNTASENPAMNIGAIAIYDGVLTPTEVSALGVAGTIIPVPEPSSLLLCGLGGLSMLRLRRRLA